MRDSANITELPMRAVFELKGRSEEVAETAGIAELPTRPNSRIEEAEFEIHRVGRETWMLTAAIEQEAEWGRRLESAAETPNLLAVLVSDTYRFVEIAGQGREDLLAAASSVDFRRLGPDATLFTEVFDHRSLLIVRPCAYEIGIENSLYEFMLLRLKDAAGQSTSGC